MQSSLPVCAFPESASINIRIFNPTGLAGDMQELQLSRAIYRGSKNQQKWNEEIWKNVYVVAGLQAEDACSGTRLTVRCIKISKNTSRGSGKCAPGLPGRKPSKNIWKFTRPDELRMSPSHYSQGSFRHSSFLVRLWAAFNSLFSKVSLIIEYLRIRKYAAFSYRFRGDGRLQCGLLIFR